MRDFVGAQLEENDSATVWEWYEPKVQDFRKQVAAGVPMAVGSDVGPFSHGTQAQEFVLMVKHGARFERAFEFDRHGNL